MNYREETLHWDIDELREEAEERTKEVADLKAQIAKLQAELHTERVRVDELRKMYSRAVGAEQLFHLHEIDQLERQLSGNTGEFTPQQDALKEGKWA